MNKGFAVVLAGLAWAQVANAGALASIEVRLAPGFSQAVSGRLLVFAERLKGDALPAKVDAGEFDPSAVDVAAQEVVFAGSQAAQVIDLDQIAYPTPFSQLAPGAYAVQAVLDVDHRYAYAGRSPQDPISPVVRMEVGGGAQPPVLTLSPGGPRPDPFQAPKALSAATQAKVAASVVDVDSLNFVSPSLTRFWGRPTELRGFVVRPPGYIAAATRRYPTVYWTHGFGGSLPMLRVIAAQFSADMRAGRLPPMIIVLLDESLPTGTHEFADSVNNGPWGQALTGELIPHLERVYRMDARASGRFVTGHSSGGWATLWLQTRYPTVFGGAWATSPDSSDFHDFTGIDIYAPKANAYRRADGSVIPLVRDHAKVLASFETFAREEAALGAYGGQISSFDWVFSPRGADGRPMPLFERSTGEINPAVVAYWKDNYDIAWRVRRDARALKPLLSGKLHVVVGTADTFYLDGPAHRLQAAFDAAGIKAEFRYLPDRTHFDLYKTPDDPRGLETEIFWSLYRQARPGSALKPVAGKS